MTPVDAEGYIRQLEEQYGERWIAKAMHYLTDCEGFARASKSGLLANVVFDDPPAPPHVPKYGWIQTVYCNDCLIRGDDVKASITSTFGKVLKMDSTKKVNMYTLLYEMIQLMKCSYIYYEDIHCVPPYYAGL